MTPVKLPWNKFACLKLTVNAEAADVMIHDFQWNFVVTYVDKIASVACPWYDNLCSGS